ncbi:MAG: gamma-glutamyltransferase [Gemmatimonadales bacterium]|nr:gamma-glutamyltransferase [Gemmatimonadales bacterium]MDG2240614.1 gamma-glutamyltransferase [Longimicrobiales bacterium]MBT3497870.1 gamma-glutamyltransferase [Gemmatimonadales bacterium]MBT3775392.1 gamma-glutamyltransferase [Gemmatimonadales bacterium]MBT3958777.1 gamma-glutamyltransferase [Gemmatimonadales bacterium]
MKPRRLFFAALLVSLSTAAGCSAPDRAPSGDAQAMGGSVVYAPQNRPDVRGTRGAVSAGHPLAAQAGLRVLQDGGTATDAIIAMAGVLAVVRPHMNGIGGDAFGIFYDGATGEVTTLNGSGRSGALATPGFFTSQGLDEVPEKGAMAVSVPGAVAAWVDAHERYGSMPFADLLQPAIHFASEGFPVSRRLQMDFEAQGGDLNEAGKALYLPSGSAPPLSSLLVNPALGATLTRIAQGGKAAYYTGPVAQRLAAFVEAEGGHLRASDFEAHTSNWVDPLQGDYLDHTFVVMPPNTQGIAQLSYMEMAKSHPISSLGHNSTDYLHTMIELKKLAFADRDRWVADPTKADVPVDRLLDPEYLRARAEQVDPDHAAEDVEPGFGAEGGATDTQLDDSGDTVYMTAVDRWGNAVSWIQSNFAGFGSGLLDTETGVLLHNRGALYTLEEGHPNQVAPGKRPYHTLTPMMALRDGSFAFTIGTPGGDSQTQTLLQIVHNLLLFEMTPQEAIEAPRFRSYNGLLVDIEDRVNSGVLTALNARGHGMRLIEGWTATFGGAQMILVEPGTGTLTVGSDPRREAYGLAY